MLTTDIQRVRSFNRTVAEGIGALEDHFLGLGRPLGEARLLWEIGPDGADIRQLRDRLGLDSGYISRLLRSLERQRLVKVHVSADDRRVRRAKLTTSGKKERAELDRRSDDVALRILEPLTAKQRATFLSAVGEVERLLQASMVRFAVERPTSTEAQWCWSQYFAEIDHRFESGFDPAIALPVEATELTPPAGALILARLHGRPIGCGAVKLYDDGRAYLKRMWISATVRGLGLGRRLLRELEEYARSAGASVVQLETNRALVEAIALYRQSGYVEVEPFNDEPYAHHWFEKRL
jgi:DNA-binding MarR family transcriptional regulator/N-acetylglutamate synthase-like GNAT family acetyltransferase